MRKKLIVALTLCSTIAYGQKYDVKADPFEQIKVASQTALQDNKHIFVMIGGDWCIWCRAFDKLSATDTTIQKIWNDSYEVVHVNYSKDNKNEAFLEAYQNPTRFGFPVFLILDAKGNLLHTQNSAYLEDPSVKGHQPQKVAHFLKAWTPEAIHYQAPKQ